MLLVVLALTAVQYGSQDALSMKDKLDTLGAWALGLLWIPLACGLPPATYATRFSCSRR